MIPFLILKLLANLKQEAKIEIKNIEIKGLIHMSKVNSIMKEKIEWIIKPTNIASPIHLISKYSNKEQNIKDVAKPRANIKVVRMK